MSGSLYEGIRAGVWSVLLPGQQPSTARPRYAYSTLALVLNIVTPKHRSWSHQHIRGHKIVTPTHRLWSHQHIGPQDSHTNTHLVVTPSLYCLLLLLLLQATKYKCRAGNNQCDVSLANRRSCQACRWAASVHNVCLKCTRSV